MDGEDVARASDDGHLAAALDQTGENLREKLGQTLTKFWRQQLRDVHGAGKDINEFKNHPLPLARIKKIMKSDEDVRMISSEAPILFAKACEIFILELTHRAWAYSEANKRRTLQQPDLSSAVYNHETDLFEFLQDTVPRIETIDQDNAPTAAAALPSATTGAAPAQPAAAPAAGAGAATTPPGDGTAGDAAGAGDATAPSVEASLEAHAYEQMQLAQQQYLERRKDASQG